jgi:hypothetical protein
MVPKFDSARPLPSLGLVLLISKAFPHIYVDMAIDKEGVVLAMCFELFGDISAL